MAQIIGFNLKKISISREDEIKGKGQVKYDINVKDIKKEKLEISKDKDVLSFDFAFVIKYEPNIANIEFGGNVLLLVEPKESKDILKEWKKKKISDNYRLMIFNLILIKCSIKALELEDDLNLPYHIPVPKLTPAQQSQDNTYTG